jgi:hypothetical protein
MLQALQLETATINGIVVGFGVGMLSPGQLVLA